MAARENGAVWMSAADDNLFGDSSDSDEGEAAASSPPRPATATTAAQESEDDDGSSDSDSGSGSGSDSDSDDGGSSRKKKRKGQRGGQKKRARTDVSMFVDDMAEVSDDDDDEDDDDEDIDGLIADEGREAELASREIDERAERRAIEQQESEGMDVHETVRALEERHRQEKRTKAKFMQGVQAGKFTQADQQAMLPSLDDPKLYVVKVKTGKEPDVVLALMNKCLAFERQGKSLNILSIFTPGIKGYVYIETHREMYAKEAVKGLRLIMGWSMKLVPTAEMTAALHIARQKKPIKVGQWVRITRGWFKGDLGKCEEVREGGTKAIIKLMPRIDFSGLAAAAITDEDPSKGIKSYKRPKAEDRPVQNYFKPNDIDDVLTPFISVSNVNFGAGLDLGVDGSMKEFFGENYSDGMLYKEMKVKTMLKITDVQPTLEETKNFKKQGGEDEEDDPFADLMEEEQQTDLSSRIEEIGFSRGDRVMVCEGELKDLMGTVISVNQSTNIVTMAPSEDVGAEFSRLNFPATQLIKYVQFGDHVKVINGRYAGETGRVVNTQQAGDDGGRQRWIAIVLTDNGAREIQVFVRDVRESREVATSLDRLGGYVQHDLVLIGQTAVGVIVRIGRDDFSVITQNGTVQKFNLQEIRGKRNAVSARAVALDASQNQIACDDVVMCIEGPHRGAQGTIKHMHRAFLFLHSATRLENAGIFVVRARNVRMANAVGQQGNVMQADRRKAAFERRNHGKDEMWCGNTVKITKGEYKGYLGVVKEATETMAKVEISAKYKTINISLSNIKNVGNKGGATEEGRSMFKMADVAGGKTPSLAGSATPMHQTPMHGTPMADGMEQPPPREHPARSGASR